MKLAEANQRLNQLSGKPFGELFSCEQIENIIINKGKTGQLLELALGMKLSNTNLDFEDGELKTNKCDRTGKPLETVFITQIASVIDDMLTEKPFEETHLYEKIDNILYVPVCKVGFPAQWMFLPSIHIDLTKPQFASLREIWRDDYYSICKQLEKHIETSKDGFIHTSNGTHIQVRSKDSKPYHPIFSSVYNREVSNKNHAFYFQKQFVYDIQKMAKEV
ncbi:MutH/Sau3AI family endonuclease [Chryseobacterium sp.]|uniref:MutH/Sau3AI family endonuclease n=1 Tax=Chryseobacterium sp. TaxID=1871047 RepID=UPI002FCAE2D1